MAYKEDLEKVHTLLSEIAKNNPLCLDEPEPLILFRDFGNSGISILFGVWFEKQNYLTVKNSVFKTIKNSSMIMVLRYPSRTCRFIPEKNPNP